VTPTKRSASSEKARIGALRRRDICHRTLAKLNSADIATYRDERLKTVGPATVIREMNLISHALEIAQREWGYWFPRNPAKMVRRPSLPQGRKRRLKAGGEALILGACDRGRNPWLNPLSFSQSRLGCAGVSLLDCFGSTSILIAASLIFR
jgi:hypothetical protein